MIRYSVELKRHASSYHGVVADLLSVYHVSDRSDCGNDWIHD